MRIKEEVIGTDNPSVWRKAQQMMIKMKDKRCTLCPPHGGENSRKGRKIKKNWKKKRKIKYQVKEVQ